MAFTNIFQLKGPKLKNKGHMNFYECCDLTKKVCLECVLLLRISSVFYHQVTGALFSSTPLRKQEQLEHRAMVVAPQGQVREEIRLVNSLDYE